MYPIELVTPMAKDLTDFGYESLNSAEQVDAVLGNKEGSVLMVVNSVCGCAAGNARPAAKFALQNAKKPTKAVTVFAGVDKEAVEKAREYLLPYPPFPPAELWPPFALAWGWATARLGSRGCTPLSLTATLFTHPECSPPPSKVPLGVLDTLRPGPVHWQGQRHGGHLRCV